MATRSKMLSRQVALAAERARDAEAAYLLTIMGNMALKGLGSSGAAMDECYKRRLRTVTELLDLRVKLEGETPVPANDQATWYADLVENIIGITDQQRARLAAGVDADSARFLGGRGADFWRVGLPGDIERLRQQYVTEAETLRDNRTLEAEMPKPSLSNTHITLNINNSEVANLNLGTQVGQIRNSVGELQRKGLQQVAEAVKALTEEIMAAPPDLLTNPKKQEAVELVATMAEEFEKPPVERRVSALHVVGAGLFAIVRHVDKIAAAYDLLRAAAKAYSVDLP